MRATTEDREEMADREHTQVDEARWRARLADWKPGKALVVDPDLVKPPTNGCFYEVRVGGAGPRGCRPHGLVVTGIPTEREAETIAGLAQEVIDRGARATMFKHVGCERVPA